MKSDLSSWSQETIVAISTPPGRGGIGVVRLAGPLAVAIAGQLLRLRNPLAHATARFAEVVDPETAAKLDESVVTFFAAPNSYTGDDIVEIAAHGSPVILEMLVRQCLNRGARLARPGEFTERAFLSGRIDLTQAEAVKDLIGSQTLYQARVAAGQMGGALSRRVHPLKEALVGLIARLEAGIDFAEDDIEVAGNPEILTAVDTLIQPLNTLAASFEHGRIIHSGLTLAIVGRPNAGKSSLFNALLKRERAIVTASPGTTRDLVTETVAIGGIPLHLVDTAGLREATDEAESIGIRKSRETMADADLVMLVVDSTLSLTDEERELIATLAERKALLVFNKSDIGSHIPTISELPTVQTSALTGEGMAELQDALLALVSSSGAVETDAVLTSLRQHEEVSGALKGLLAARAAAATNIPHEMVLLDLYSALRHLDSLTGETTPDDVLNLIFSTFCIGK